MYRTPAEKFSILGVETRVKIIELLKKKGALGAKIIAEEFKITTAAVSQHLKILKQAGLVSCERKGYHIPYSINEEALEDCRKILSKVCTCSNYSNVSIITDEELDEKSVSCLVEYKGKLEQNLIKVNEKIQSMEEG